MIFIKNHSFGVLFIITIVFIIVPELGSNNKSERIVTNLSNFMGGFFLKRIFIAVIALLLVTSISNIAFAHSHLEGSNPADGDVVTESLNEITLNFDGGIEQGSSLEITSLDGQAVEVQEITIVEDTLTATVANPLPNAEYQVDWSIMSADGHSLEGEFAFTVNAPVPVEEETEAPSETTEEIEDTELPEQSTENQESAENGAEESTSMTIIWVILFVVLVAGGALYFTKRKK